MKINHAFRLRENKPKQSQFQRQKMLLFPGNWIPAPRLRGDEFTPAKAGAGMTNQTMFLLKQYLRGYLAQNRPV